MTRSESPSLGDPSPDDPSLAADESQAPPPPQDSAGELGRLQAEVSELKDAWLRAKAETDNARKIAQADVAKAHKYAAEKFAEDMLPVKDALEQTLAAADVSVDTLKAGAELTLRALQAAFAVIDSANGVGSPLDVRDWTFLSTDLTVHLHRTPVGPWTGIVAETSIGPDGVGTCSAVLHDSYGAFGRSAQILLVRPRA